MPQKQKLSAEEKAKVIEDYINNRISLSEAARRGGVAQDTISQWARNYEADGMTAFMTCKNRVYSPELKWQAVEDYLSGAASMSMTNGCSASAGSEISVLQSSTAIGVAPDRQRALNILPRIFWTGSFMPKSPTKSGQQRLAAGRENFIFFHCPLDGMRFIFAAAHCSL